MQPDLPGRRLAIGVVDDARDALDLVFADQLFEFLLDAIAVLEVRDFLDDDDFGVLFRFEFNLRPHRQCAASGLVALANAESTTDDSTRREIGTGEHFNDLIDAHIRVIDQQLDCGCNFGQIVRRHAGRHTDRNPGRTVHEQVRKPRGEDDRLFVALVIGPDEIDRVLVQVFEQVSRLSRQTGFGVSHGCGAETGDRAEVPLLVDQHFPHHPVLAQSNQGGIDHRFAVRVIVTRSIARDLGALHSSGVRAEIQVIHRDQNTPLSWL